jgi:hypothetical protein
MASTSNDWMVPTVSLETQLSRALDRRTAAHLCRDDLRIVVDGLIVRTYDQKALIDSLLGRARHLEVELVLARDARPLQPPSDEHQRWAREVLQELG